MVWAVDGDLFVSATVELAINTAARNTAHDMDVNKLGHITCSEGE